MEILKVKNLVKTYKTGDSKFNAVDHLTFSIKKGDFVAIINSIEVNKNN